MNWYLIVSFLLSGFFGVIRIATLGGSVESVDTGCILDLCIRSFHWWNVSIKSELNFISSTWYQKRFGRFLGCAEPTSCPNDEKDLQGMLGWRTPWQSLVWFSIFLLRILATTNDKPHLYSVTIPLHLHRMILLVFALSP